LIAAIGELVLDVTIAPDSELGQEDDREALIRLGGGGQAANFCAWAASLGEPARLITRTGGDELAGRLVAELEAGGVQVVGPASDEPTGAVAVLVGRGGRRAFANQAGASRGLRPEEVDPSWLDGVRLLHLSAYALYREPLGAAALRASALARERGAALSVDLSSADLLRAFGSERMTALLGRLRPELLFATDREAAVLTVPLEQLAGVPVVKLGARGCRVFGRHMPAPAVPVRDGTGAGDAFAAAFCVAYVEGATPLEAAGRAVLDAGGAVGKLGARP